MAERCEKSVLAYIGLGSNMDDPERQVSQGLEDIAIAGVGRLLDSSHLYLSPAFGPVEQPDYVNAVAALQTDLAPRVLLTRLQAIEDAHGRLRTTQRWGPRTLDLDILLYGALQLKSAALTIPHPGMAQREFVLVPLEEITPPGFTVPGLGPIEDLVRSCPRFGLKRLTGSAAGPSEPVFRREVSRS